MSLVSMDRCRMEEMKPAMKEECWRFVFLWKDDCRQDVDAQLAVTGHRRRRKKNSPWRERKKEREQKRKKKDRGNNKDDDQGGDHDAQ